ncbi:MAG: hypothetical protein EXR36_11360 [Betaproteobacteria bacterium]|nr:hypothetical protein [Betaproteobacteria bacterium]
MRYVSMFSGLGLVLALAASMVQAGDVDLGAVVGGAVGGGVGAGVGSHVGGTKGAIIGGAIGGATGAAVGSSTRKPDVVVKEKVVVKERVRVVEAEEHEGPPGHRKGKKKGWKKKHRDD